MRPCRICHVDKPDTEFRGAHKGRWPQHDCKECLNAVERKKNAEKRAVLEARKATAKELLKAGKTVCRHAVPTEERCFLCL